MHFIDKHKRGIALVVAFAFFYLIQISAAPLPEAQAPAKPDKKTVVSGKTDHPGSFEPQASAKEKHRKKSPLVAISIGLVLAGAIAAVLILVVFKTKYDITGGWIVTYQFEGFNPGNYVIRFTGTKNSGSFSIGAATFGTYTVKGKSVTWVYSDGLTTYTGKIIDVNRMEGTMIGRGISGTWQAERSLES